MSTPLPDIIDPSAFAERGRVVAGVLALRSFERLRDHLVSAAGEVRFELRFAKEDSVVGARGRIEAEVPLQCQVCLGDLVHRIDSDVAIAFVRSVDEADRLPGAFEPMILADPHVLRIAELIEDEILLSIPHVPRHRACPAGGDAGVSGGEAEVATRRPFADLANLLQTETKQKSG